MNSFPIFNSFQRIGNFSLTDTEVFDTIEDLQEYVNNNPTAYSGQQCVVKGYPSKEYIINEDKSITLSANKNDIDSKVDKVIGKSLYELKYIEIQYIQGEGIIPFNTIDGYNNFFGHSFINALIDKDNNVVTLYTDTIISLQHSLFENNSTLLSFKSNAVGSIGVNTFKECVELTKVEIYELDILPDGTFYGCQNINAITLPKVKKIDTGYNDTFKNVSQLISLIVHISLKFSNNGLPHKVIQDAHSLNNNISIEYYIYDFPNDLTYIIGNQVQLEESNLNDIGELYELLIRHKESNDLNKINLLNLSKTLGVTNKYISNLINTFTEELDGIDSIIISKIIKGELQLQKITTEDFISILEIYFNTKYLKGKEDIESLLIGNITTHYHSQYIDKTEEFIIDPYNIVWVGDWIKVTHGYWNKFQGKNYYGFVNAIVETGAGHINIRCKIRRPERASTQTFDGRYWNADETFNGFYLKDLDNVLTPETDFARIILKIKLEQPGGNANGSDVDGSTYKWNTPNVIVDDTLLDGVQHGTWMKNTYLYAYNREDGGAFAGDVILTENDATLHEPNFEGGGILNTNLYSNYCRKHEANLIMEAFQNRLERLSANGNPDIITFVCHYSNSKQEWNYRRPMYGIQDDSIFESFHVFPINTIACGAGNPNDLDANWQTSYGEGVEFIEPTLQSDLVGLNIGGGATSWNNVHQQSPAVAIIAAKFRYIKDQTGVSWNTVRLACRATASQNGIWNKYRGYGVINCTNAITWINNLKTSFKSAAKERFEEGRGYPSFMDNVEDYTDNTPLPKRLSQEKLVSGTNIKTVNNASLLGSGNINISGGDFLTNQIFN